MELEHDSDDDPRVPAAAQFVQDALSVPDDLFVRVDPFDLKLGLPQQLGLQPLLQLVRQCRLLGGPDDRYDFYHDVHACHGIAGTLNFDHDRARSLLAERRPLRNLRSDGHFSVSSLTSWGILTGPGPGNRRRDRHGKRRDTAARTPPTRNVLVR